MKVVRNWRLRLKEVAIWMQWEQFLATYPSGQWLGSALTNKPNHRLNHSLPNPAPQNESNNTWKVSNQGKVEERIIAAMKRNRKFNARNFHRNWLLPERATNEWGETFNGRGKERVQKEKYFNVITFGFSIFSRAKSEPSSEKVGWMMIKQRACLKFFCCSSSFPLCNQSHAFSKCDSWMKWKINK